MIILVQLFFLQRIGPLTNQKSSFSAEESTSQPIKRLNMMPRIAVSTQIQPYNLLGNAPNPVLKGVRN